MTPLDFISNLWPGASRAPAPLPAMMPPASTLDDPWKISGNLPASKRKTSGKRKAKARPPAPPANGADAVVLALLRECRARGAWRMLSVTELAEAMSVSTGESSKRVKEADLEGLVSASRDGRRKLVGLHRVTREEWDRIVSAKPGVAVGLYRMAIARARRPREARARTAEAVGATQ